MPCRLKEFRWGEPLVFLLHQIEFTLSVNCLKTRAYVIHHVYVHLHG